MTSPTEALLRLDAFVGAWTVAADIPGMPGGALTGHATFAWDLDGHVLVQRTRTPVAGVPDSLTLVFADAETGELVQHYYDSRGVVRRYLMTVDGDEWRLLRTAPDFSPLDFCQRFVGRFDAERAVIRGEWQTSDDGVNWQHDFDLVYRRVADDDR
jgi:hypothetical protein